jgi:methylmalonyl-CoA/ethylmalonyl-CoA epimerase
MAEAPAWLVGTLGGVPRAGMPSGVFRWGTWMFEGGGQIEILEPIGDRGFLHRFLAERGRGIHHVTFKVPSLDEVCARAASVGYDVVGRDERDPGWKEAFLHPKQALGIVVQFAEADGTSVAPPWTPPPAPADPPPPVAIVGLRLSAQSRERAEKQWGAILEGEAHEGTAGEVVYRWPESPMRLAIEIDPARDEGPLAIEIAAARHVELPNDPHPTFGVAFRRAAG